MHQSKLILDRNNEKKTVFITNRVMRDLQFSGFRLNRILWNINEKLLRQKKRTVKFSMLLQVMVAIKQSTKDIADQLSSYKPLNRYLIWNFIKNLKFN